MSGCTRYVKRENGREIGREDSRVDNALARGVGHMRTVHHLCVWPKSNNHFIVNLCPFKRKTPLFNLIN